VGNRLTRTSTVAGVPAQTFSFDANDRLATDTYDSNGNTLTSGLATYTYDFADRLLTGPGVTNVYDGDGNRVARTAGGVNTRFLIDDLTPTGYAQVAEEVVSGAVTRRYTHGPMRISQSQLISGNWTTHYYGYDAGGTVRQLTNGSGAVTDTYDYDAYGLLIAQTGSTPNLYLYRGEQWDPSLELYYLRARWMQPRTGRFVTADKWEGCLRNWGRNAYIYADAEPIEMRDPSGYSSISYALRAPMIFLTAVEKTVEVAADVCLLGYAGSALAIAISSWDRDVTSVSVNFCFLSAKYRPRTLDWRNPANRVPEGRQPPRADPGRCTPDQHARLQDQVNMLCKSSGSYACSANDTCPVLAAKTAAASACFAARVAIGIACYDFSPNNPNDHVPALAVAAGAVGNCVAAAQGRNCY
jgi:RHS repeat-associated protein